MCIALQFPRLPFVVRVLVKSYTFTFIALVMHAESLCGLHDNLASSALLFYSAAQKPASPTARAPNTFFEDGSIPLVSLDHANARASRDTPLALSDNRGIPIILISSGREPFKQPSAISSFTRYPIKISIL